VPLTELLSLSAEGDGSCQGGGGVSNEDGRGRQRRQGRVMAVVASVPSAAVNVGGQ
jgi:hypothetical protein